MLALGSDVRIELVILLGILDLRHGWKVSRWQVCHAKMKPGCRQLNPLLGRQLKERCFLSQVNKNLMGRKYLFGEK